MPTPEQFLSKGEKYDGVILNAMESNTAVRTLASNPLLCALMCALNRFYREELPRDLRALCESACQMLLWDRDFRIGLTKMGCRGGMPLASAMGRQNPCNSETI